MSILQDATPSQVLHEHDDLRGLRLPAPYVLLLRRVETQTMNQHAFRDPGPCRKHLLPEERSEICGACQCACTACGQSQVNIIHHITMTTREKLKELFGQLNPTEQTALWGALQIASQNARDMSPTDDMTTTAYIALDTMYSVMEDLGANNNGEGWL